MFSIIFSHSISPCEKDGQWYGKPYSRFTVPCQSQEKLPSKGPVYKLVLMCSICNWIRSNDNSHSYSVTGNYCCTCNSLEIVPEASWSWF